MLFFLFCYSIFCYKRDVIVEGNSFLEFFTEMKEDGYQLNIEVTKISEGIVFVYYTAPNITNNLSFKLDPTNQQKFTGKGVYSIKIQNISFEPVHIRLVDYSDETKDDDVDNKEILQSVADITAALRKLESSYMMAKGEKEKNLQIVQRDLKWMMVLLIMPIIYVGTGYACIKVQQSFFVVKTRRRVRN